MAEPIDLTTRMKKASSKPVERRIVDLSHADPHKSGDYPLAPQSNMYTGEQVEASKAKEQKSLPNLKLI